MTQIRQTRVWLPLCAFLKLAGMCYGQFQFPTENPKPVFLVHGILVSGNNLAYLAARIIQNNPRTLVFNTYAYSGLASLTPLQQQLDGTLGQEFKNFSDAHPEGFHLIGHSQGALICRTLIQNYPQHNVRHFISIAGPQAGQYGIPTIIPQPMPLVELPPLLTVGSALFYNPIAQRTLSIANYWHDPFQDQLYLRQNTFLPYYDNRIRSERSASYKEAFVKLRRFVAIQGPGDGVIDPWQSGDFSFYNRLGTVENYTQREVYTEDLFGLRTLDEDGRFIKYIQDGVEHFDWVFNNEVIEKYILPNLD
ncbi:unnamed protein product [Bemisia tabaci]|uniref:palmitoyl-CoA hydrolase n=2 Tax=Bemisia tabaci TaxID=7038 RepID=A0A9P0EYE8_BEMTA|nr:unnamed protein product [Bemisia tabaci]